MGEVHRGSKLRYFNEKPDIRTQTILVKQHVYSCNNGGDHIQPLISLEKVYLACSVLTEQAKQLSLKLSKLTSFYYE